MRVLGHYLQVEAGVPTTTTGRVHLEWTGTACKTNYCSRLQFIATNDTALCALPGEFTDHVVMVSLQTPGHPGLLWIPASKETLRRILKGMGGYVGVGGRLGVLCVI